MILAQKWLSAGAKRRYTVTFNLNGGKIDGSEGPIIVYNVPHGRKIGRIKPSTDPTKHLEDGRIFPFTGWDTSDETRVTSDMTVSAVYSTECLLDYYESNDPSKNGEYIFIPGIYEIKLVGAGGKAAVGMWPGTVTPSKTNCFVAAGGGSGALLVGQVTLLANTRFTVNIGSAQNNSKLTSGSWLNLDVPHGSNGSAGWFWATGGAGGDKDSIVSTGLTNPTTTSGSAGTEMTHVATWDGDYGAWASGGASTIANTNYGAGGWAESAYLYRTATAGEAGYVLIHKVGEAPKTKVTFMDGDGDIFKMVLNVIKGTLLGTIKPTETPLKSSTDMYDYTFKNWDKTDAYEINEDTVVNSVFEEHLRKFTVTFKLNGGNIGGSTEDVVVENVTYGTLFKDIKPSNPTLENYNFTGWGMDDDTPVTYSTNVTAQYELAVEILQ